MLAHLQRARMRRRCARRAHRVRACLSSRPTPSTPASLARPRASPKRRRRAQRIPARPRSHHPFHRVSPARIQDAGLRQSRRRPFPHAPDAQPRSRADRALDRAQPAAQRRPDRGHRAGARPRSHAVRPRRARTRSTSACAITAASSTICSRCASSMCSSSATPPSTGSTCASRRAKASSSTARSKNARKLGDVGERFLRRQQPSLEAQLANLADEIAYNNHDVDDGLRSGLLTLEQLESVSDLRAPSGGGPCAQFPGLDERRLIHETVRRMINTLVDRSDPPEPGEHRTGRAPAIVDDVRAAPAADRLQRAMPARAAGAEALSAAQPVPPLSSHPHDQQGAARRARAVPGVQRRAAPAAAPISTRRSARRCPRAIADYIAGMTDRYAHPRAPAPVCRRRELAQLADCSAACAPSRVRSPVHCG